MYTVQYNYNLLKYSITSNSSSLCHGVILFKRVLRVMDECVLFVILLWVMKSLKDQTIRNNKLNFNFIMHDNSKL